MLELDVRVPILLRRPSCESLLISVESCRSQWANPLVEDGTLREFVYYKLQESAIGLPVSRQKNWLIQSRIAQSEHRSKFSLHGTETHASVAYSDSFAENRLCRRYTCRCRGLALRALHIGLGRAHRSFVEAARAMCTLLGQHDCPPAGANCCSVESSNVRPMTRWTVLKKRCCRQPQVRLPSSKEEIIIQAHKACIAAWKAGVKRQKIQILLPLIGATILDDWPGGIRQACSCFA